jgi:hypothetical protein
VISGDRAALWLVPDGEDQVVRLERVPGRGFRVVILLRSAMPKAQVKGGKIECATLRGLLDELDKVFSRPPRPLDCWT